MTVVDGYAYAQESGLFARGNQALMQECAALYSSNYGYWNEPGQLIRDPVTLSPKRIRKWFNDDTVVATARLGAELIAYAIAEQHTFEDRGIVSWVTQLVVHKDHRNKDVAKQLLYSLWGFSDHYCWGLVSANPFAVRALEKATRRRCDPLRVLQDKDFLLRFGQKWTSYVSHLAETDLSAESSQINTDFDLDHSEVPQMLKLVQTKETKWKLGRLHPKWEWMAFTFRDQDQMQLTASEVEQMLAASDDVAQQAYSRMTLDSSHKWMRHTEKELDFIVQECGLQAGSSLLDVGCGSGRHTIAAARRGIAAVGVDFCIALIERAKAAATSARALDPLFRVLDFRREGLAREFDCVLCLYDVIGSAAAPTSELQLMRNIRDHLKSGGHAVISVMNLAMTRKHAKHLFSLETEHNRLLELKPSNTMESSGDVFNPDFYMLDAAKGVVYRKEQFSAGRDLPAELIVRDRRYTKASITSLVGAVGLRVLLCRAVHAGGWDKDLMEDDDSAKEILVVCKKD